jgi:D-alanyl-D-alanine carboxypeptidase/D-alanyl-D-alanine-endopeptidase (penicillin-binding protein 4)
MYTPSMYVARGLVLVLGLWANAAAIAQTGPAPAAARPGPAASSPAAAGGQAAPTAGSAAMPVHTPYPSGASTSLGEQIAMLLASPGAEHVHWGIAVTSLDGVPLYGLNEGQLFRPASVAKLYTTSTAMALLGPNSTVQTRIDFPAAGPDGIVHGNLTLIGGGDANLSGRSIPYVEPGSANASTLQPDPLRAVDQLADSVVQTGVRHITGDIIGSDLAWEPYPQGWGTDDLLWGYGAPVSGLLIDDSEVRLAVTPGTTQGEPATVTLTPDVGYYHIVSSVRTTDKPQDSIAIHRDLGSGQEARALSVDGMVRLGHPYATELAIADPAYYAALALRHELQARGVKVDGEVRAPHLFAGNPDNFLHDSRSPIGLPQEVLRGAAAGDCIGGCPATTVLTHSSVPLSQDVTVTLKDSLNLHAEIMLRRLGLSSGDTSLASDSPLAQGARVVRQWLINAGLDPGDFVFYDGSGLSARDLVTPRATAQLLAYAGTQPWFAQWKAALPVGGVDGTLEHRFTDSPLQGHIFAKTGTLGESRALAGYVNAASGRQVIFAIFADDHSPGSADRAVMDKVVAAIAAAE